MDEPLVCCILPYHNHEYYKKAIECFDQQNYSNKALSMLDTRGLHQTIGSIRNGMNSLTPKGCLISHWDHDDWSAPDRLSSQVGLLTKNNVKVTGYHDLPFYDVANYRVVFYDSKMTGYAVGTSLMYRREVWERTPFPDKQCGEDAAWQHAVRRDQGIGVVSTSSAVDGRPMIVARHHTGCVTEAQEQPRSMLLRQGDNYTPASAELDRAVRACIVPQSVVR